MKIRRFLNNAASRPDRVVSSGSDGSTKAALRRVRSVFPYDVLKLIVVITAAVVVLSVCFELTRTLRLQNRQRAVFEAFEQVTGADNYETLDIEYESGSDGVSVLGVYRPSADQGVSAYCFCLGVSGEEYFDLAVCLDAYSSVILGVALVEGTRTAGSGEHVLWLESGYLDMYTNMNESYAYAVPVLDGAPATTAAIKNAVLTCMQIVAAINGGERI